MNIKFKKCLATLLCIGTVLSTLSAQSPKAKSLTLGVYKNEGHYGNLYQLEKNEGYNFLGKLPVFVGDLLSLTKENRKTQDLLFVYTVPKYFYRASKNRHLPLYYGLNSPQTHFIFNNMTAVIDAPFDKMTIGDRDAYLSTDAGMFLVSRTPDKLSVLSLTGQAQICENLHLVTENFHFLTTFDNPEIVGSTSLQFSYDKFSFSTVMAYNFDTRKLPDWQSSEFAARLTRPESLFSYPSVFFYFEGKMNLF